MLPAGGSASFEVAEYSLVFYTWRKPQSSLVSPGVYRVEDLNPDTTYVVRAVVTTGSARYVSGVSARFETLTPSEHQSKTQREWFEAQKESTDKLTSDYNTYA